MLILYLLQTYLETAAFETEVFHTAGGTLLLFHPMPNPHTAGPHTHPRRQHRSLSSYKIQQEIKQMQALTGTVQ